MGLFTEGSGYAEEAVRLAEAVDHPLTRVQAYVWVSILDALKGEFRQAIQRLEQALALGQAMTIRFFMPWIASGLGSAYAATGRLAEAMPLLEGAVTQAEALGISLEHSSRVAALGEGYLLVGQNEAASAHATHALALARQYQERGNEAWCLRLLGEVAAQRDPPGVAEADGYYRQAMGLAAELGMRPLTAHCHRGLGTLYARSGRRIDARTELATSIALYRAMDMTFWLPHAEAALAGVT
jgi:tetratricopeptide (TPR) repeat protein